MSATPKSVKSSIQNVQRGSRTPAAAAEATERALNTPKGRPTVPPQTLAQPPMQEQVQPPGYQAGGLMLPRIGRAPVVLKNGVPLATHRVNLKQSIAMARNETVGARSLLKATKKELDGLTRQQAKMTKLSAKSLWAKLPKAEQKAAIAADKAALKNIAERIKQQTRAVKLAEKNFETVEKAHAKAKTTASTFEQSRLVVK